MNPQYRLLRGGLHRGALLWRLLFLSLGLVILSGGMVLVVREGLARWSRQKQPGTGAVDLTVPKGASLESIARSLEAEGLIDRAELFMAYAWTERRHRSLQAGEYVLETPISPGELLLQLQKGSFQKRLTIPEGWTARQIAAQLVKDGWIESEQQWLDRVSRPLDDSLFGFTLPEGTEGFCFPDTYFLEDGDGAETIHRRMLDEFARVWLSLEPERRDARSEKLSPREVVVLASMIEREARSVDELPAIASVYLNRLKIRMRLQCCATVHYALGEVWDRPLRHADLKVDSPFNTYIHYGLPPAPIGNPGREALEAVLRPEQNDYLYYVYKGDGTHAFTRTYREHLRAAKQFREADPHAGLIKGRNGDAGGA